MVWKHVGRFAFIEFSQRFYYYIPISRRNCVIHATTNVLLYKKSPWVLLTARGHVDAYAYTLTSESLCNHFHRGDNFSTNMHACT